MDERCMNGLNRIYQNKHYIHISNPEFTLDSREPAMDLSERILMRTWYGTGVSVMILATAFALQLSGETPHPLDRFILSGNDVEGFALLGKPAYYRPESLWNYIDGGALPYIDYGVVDVMTYKGVCSPDTSTITIDIYDMADSLGAFGIYSSERFPDYTYLDIGVEGYLTENTLCFWKDRYYIKIFFNQESPPTLAPLKQVAVMVDKRIPAGGGMPVYFSLFPKEGRLERTEAYSAKNVLGQEYLKNAFVVSYQRGGENFQIYLIKAPNPGEASKNFTAYREFLCDNGSPETRKISLGDESFIGKESWYGTMVFVRKGQFILGSSGLSDEKLAQNYLETLSAGLPR
jgi:hypothetical protein